MNIVPEVVFKDCLMCWRSLSTDKFVISNNRLRPICRECASKSSKRSYKNKKFNQELTAHGLLFK